jgi:hypothetical protein
MSLRVSRIRLVWSGLPGSTSPRCSRIAGEIVQRVLRRRGFRLRAGADDVALRSRHRFVPKQFHERVDADVGVGQFSGIGVPQRVYERAWAAVGVGPGELERAQDAVLQGATGYSLAVAANKQWGSGRPAVELIVAAAAARCCGGIGPPG